MAEQKYVMISLEDYEDILEVADESTLVLLERVYGHLTGDSFVDKNDYWEIDPEQALEVSMELQERLSKINNIKYEYGEPNCEFVYTESERNLLNEVLYERGELKTKIEKLRDKYLKTGSSAQFEALTEVLSML